MQETPTIPLDALFDELPEFTRSLEESMRTSGLSTNEILGTVYTQLFRAIFDVSFSDVVSWWRAGGAPSAAKTLLEARMMGVFDAFIVFNAQELDEPSVQANRIMFGNWMSLFLKENKTDN